MKIKIKFYGPLLFLAGTLLAGCTEKVVNKFDEDSSLYFYRSLTGKNSKGIIQYDSINYSFFLAGSAQEAEIWLDVRLTGNVSDTDRPISIRQANASESRAAVAGTHYVPFDDPRMEPYLVMPAGENNTAVPIILKRTTTMDNQEFRLVVEIEPNRYFTEGLIKDYYGQNSFIINATAKVSKPVTWDSTYDLAFGEWGVQKMIFLIDYVGYVYFDEALNTETRYFWNLRAKAILAEYEEKYGPLYEDDNYTRVTIP